MSTPDIPAATKHLQVPGAVRRDEIEPLPDGFQGFRIASPASVIHLVAKSDK